MGRFPLLVKLKDAKGVEKDIKLVVDTGAARSLIDKSLVEGMEFGKLEDSAVRDVQGNIILTNKVGVTVFIGECKTSAVVEVTKEKDKVESVLGADALQQMDAVVLLRQHKVIPRNCEPVIVPTIRYKKIFGGDVMAEEEIKEEKVPEEEASKEEEVPKEEAPAEGGE